MGNLDRDPSNRGPSGKALLDELERLRDEISH